MLPNVITWFVLNFTSRIEEKGIKMSVAYRYFSIYEIIEIKID